MNNSLIALYFRLIIYLKHCIVTEKNEGPGFETVETAIQSNEEGKIQKIIPVIRINAYNNRGMCDCHYVWPILFLIAKGMFIQNS